MTTRNSACWALLALLVFVLPLSAQPLRDNLGDVIAQFDTPHAENAGLAWDGTLVWGTCRTASRHLWAKNLETGELVHDYIINQPDAIGLGYDPVEAVFWVNEYVAPGNPSIAHLYDAAGNEVRTVRCPRGGHNDFCTDGTYIYVSSELREGEPGAYRIFRMNREGGDVVEGPNLRSMVPNQARTLAVEYVAAHPDGHFWVMSGAGPGNQGHISEFSINWDNGQAERVADFASNNDYPHQGLTHDGYNLIGGGTWGGQTAYIYDDGIRESYGVAGFEAAAQEFGPVVAGEQALLTLRISNLAQVQDEVHRLTFAIEDRGDGPDWLTSDPPDGTIEAGAAMDVDFVANTQGLQLGEYTRTIRITTNDPNRAETDLEAHIFVVNGFGGLRGQVTRLSDGTPLEGVVLSMEHFGFRQVTDAQGNYDFGRLPAFTYRLQVAMPDYLRELFDQLEVQPDNVRELNVALRQSFCTPRPEQVEATLPPNDSLGLSLTLSNEAGNGPLRWNASLNFPRDRVVDPWTRRFDFPVSGVVDDLRINGAECDDAGNFYVVGGSTGRGTGNVYVFDHDGNHTRTFPQFTASAQGMRDLAWDGRLLWGADNRKLYGFTPAGELLDSLAITLNPCRSVAYDPDHNWLWISDIVQSLIALDRQGNVVRNFPVQGPRKYGIAWYPEDPDGFKLWMITSVVDTVCALQKVNVDSRQVRFVTNLPLNREAERPRSLAISGTWDPYNWVAVAAMNDNGGSVSLWNISGRTNWVTAAPLSGVIPAGESRDLTVSFASLGYLPQTELTASLDITHDGRGGEVSVPISMDVSEAGGLSQRALSMEMGWNLVSLNVAPEGDFASVVAPLVDAGQLIIAKNGAGEFYRPDRGFNNIDAWHGEQAYWLKLRNRAELRVMGRVIASNAPIDLGAGWNNVSYLPRAAVAAPVALGALAGNLILARDGTGRFYLPAYGFDDLDRMHEGAGYQLKVAEAGQLVYRTGGRDGFVPRYTAEEAEWLSGCHAERSEASRLEVETRSFPPIASGVRMTSLMHHLLLTGPGLVPGDRLEARTPAGLVAGRGVVGKDGMAAITLWGDDPSTPEVEGFAEGEVPEIVNCKLSIVNCRLLDGSAAFSDGGWGVLAVDKRDAYPTRFELVGAYPNPFNSLIHIQYNLAKAGRARLAINDVSGREVALLVDANQGAGSYEATWSGAGVSSGLYICRLEQSGSQKCLKLVLVK